MEDNLALNYQRLYFVISKTSFLEDDYDTTGLVGFVPRLITRPWNSLRDIMYCVDALSLVIPRLK